ncbi:MAG: MbnP family protein [Panacagrimonas sp.]
MAQPFLRFRHLMRLGLALASLWLAACAPSAPEVRTLIGPVLTLQLDHRLGGMPIESGQTRLRIAAGETLRLTSLRYYLSNFGLVRPDGQRLTSPTDPQSDRGYFLVDAADPASRRLRLEGFAPGAYREIEFLVGVDEARNRAGAQTGVLDPARGMFWTWHTGYIFFALEGQAEPSSRALEFHVGGDARYARKLRLALPEGFALSDKAESELHLVADLSSIFGDDPAWGLAAVHGAAERDASIRLADAYGRMFRIDVGPTKLAGSP